MDSLLSFLKEKNWESKYSLYRDKFEYIEVINEVFSPKISVIVISWRLHPDTLKSFEIISKMRKKVNFELIFVDNGGKPGEFDSLKKYIDSYVRLNQNTGAYLARNVGATFAKSPLLLFLEDDGLPDEQLIEAHILTHLRYDVYTVMGSSLFKTENELNELQHHYYNGEKVLSKFSVLEGNTSYKAEVFFHVGGWDDAIQFGGGGKELAIKLYLFNKNIGKQIYSPICFIYHDYAINKKHLEEKREKQKKSFERLSEKYSLWDTFEELWSDYEREKPCLVETEFWKLNSKFQEEYDFIEVEIKERNRDKILTYMNGKIPLDDIAGLKDLNKQLEETYSICIFGAGEYGLKVYSKLVEYGLKINYFVDNDTLKWGREMFSIPIIKPFDLNSSHFILIASTWAFEISKQLEQMGLKKNENYKIVI